jgi:serine/threonine protein phosphatase PrpC
VALEVGPGSDKSTESRPHVELRAAVKSDIGVVREHNEDAAHIHQGHDFFIVADGMGGHAAGEIASAMAVDTVREALEAAKAAITEFALAPTEDGRKGIVALLEAAVRSAHQAVFERGAKETDKQGMGTTLDVVLLAGSEAFIAHVGDSRTYLIRDGKANQITTDHTVAEVLVIEGKLSLEEAQISPLRTILVNAIGVAPDVGVEMAHIQLRKDDQLLLSSDGLHDYFPTEQELADRLLAAEPDDALTELIELAKERGGHDNITGVVVRVLDVQPPPDSAAPATVQTPELSDGVPAPIGRDDTLPVDVGEDKAPKQQTATGDKDAPAAHRSTEPMGAVDAEPVRGEEDTIEMKTIEPPPELDDDDGDK